MAWCNNCSVSGGLSCRSVVGGVIAAVYLHVTDVFINCVSILYTTVIKNSGETLHEKYDIDNCSYIATFLCFTMINRRRSSVSIYRAALAIAFRGCLITWKLLSFPCCCFCFQLLEARFWKRRSFARISTSMSSSAEMSSLACYIARQKIYLGLRWQGRLTEVYYWSIWHTQNYPISFSAHAG